MNRIVDDKNRADPVDFDGDARRARPRRLVFYFSLSDCMNNVRTRMCVCVCVCVGRRCVNERSPRVRNLVTSVAGPEETRAGA